MANKKNAFIPCSRDKHQYLIYRPFNFDSNKIQLQFKTLPLPKPQYFTPKVEHGIAKFSPFLYIFTAQLKDTKCVD